MQFRSFNSKKLLFLWWDFEDNKYTFLAETLLKKLGKAVVRVWKKNAPIASKFHNACLKRIIALTLCTDPNGNIKSQFRTVKESSDAHISQVLTRSQPTVDLKLDETTFFLRNNDLPTTMMHGHQWTRCWNVDD